LHKNPLHNFLKNVLKLVSGNVFAQGLIILTSPIITRLFPPESFGIAATYASFIGVISIVACFRYELPIMLPESDKEAANILFLCFSIVMLLSCMSTILLSLYGDPLIMILQDSYTLNQYIYLMPISILLNGTILCMTYWQSRNKRFGYISSNTILSSITIQASKLSGGFYGYTGCGTLILSKIIGDALSFLFHIVILLKNDFMLFKQHIHMKTMIAMMRRYKKFPIYFSITGIMNVLSVEIPLLLMPFFFPLSIVGYYALARQVIHLPISVISSSINQVFFQQASEASHHGQLGSIVEIVFHRLVMFGIFPFLILMLFGAELFRLIFGDPWHEAGFYVQILSMSVFINFVTSPLSTVFSVNEKQEAITVIQIVLLVLRTLAIIIGGLSTNPRLSILLFSVVGIAVNLFLLLYIFRITAMRIVIPLRIIGKYFFISCPFLIIAYSFYWVLNIHFIFILGIILTCTIIFYLNVYLQMVNNKKIDIQTL